MTTVVATPGYPYPLDAERRLAEAADAVEDTRGMIRSWIEQRSNSATFGRFNRHFTTLEDVLGRMLDAIEQSLRADPVPTGGAAYARSRAAERRVGKVRATFRWYSSKYEQREAEGLDGYGRLLLAADEVVRSCFDPPFTETATPRPPDPLCYLDESFDPTATPRLRPPAGIPAGDEVVGEFVRQLPIPTIALPVTCLDKPWWLVVAAHEVGHHVYFDLDPQIAGATRQCVATALDGEDEEIVDAWKLWSTEAFADMWSVLTVGGSLAPMVGHLSAAAPAQLVAPAGTTDTYPPPLVRLALFGELAGRLGVEADAPSAAAVSELLATPQYSSLDPLAHDQHRDHLSVVPRVAEALLGLDCAGLPVTAVSGFDARLLAHGGTADGWAQQLFDSQPYVGPLDKDWSARTLLAAAAKHAGFPVEPAERVEREEKLCAFLLETLPETGWKGDLAEAGQPQVVDTSRIAEDFVGLLFEEVS